ncbi:MAG: YbaN family protein [Gammaproteobacteria bacterium]|nr:YbaN family protein [Gammaproteobacteria bacterium]
MQIIAAKPLRYLLVLAGLLCIALGIVGVFLPVLPTTPFMLLAAACFARSSPRFHSALLNSKMFGPIIQQWQAQRSIPKKAKQQAIFLIVVVFTISIVFLIQDTIIRTLMAVTAAILIGFLVRLPSGEASTAKPQ